jgi:hypothetical protein
MIFRIFSTRKGIFQFSAKRRQRTGGVLESLDIVKSLVYISIPRAGERKGREASIILRHDFRSVPKSKLLKIGKCFYNSSDSNGSFWTDSIVPANLHYLIVDNQLNLSP